MSEISKLAVVSDKAKIGVGVRVGPFSVIEDGVEIGADTVIGSHVNILSRTSIGANCCIHNGACIGDLPQDLSFDKSKKTFVRIGNNTVIREHATIHRATIDGSSTTVGDNCYLMVSSHLGHDCILANNVIVANGALLAGHVHVGEYAFISGNVVIHQYCRIGTACMIGGFTGINKDVPPYMLVRGPSVVRGINIVGLRRLKFSREAIRGIKEAYRLIFLSDLNTTQALEAIGKLDKSKELDVLTEFVRASKRGICKARDTDEEFFE